MTSDPQEAVVDAARRVMLALKAGAYMDGFNGPDGFSSTDDAVKWAIVELEQPIAALDAVPRDQPRPDAVERGWRDADDRRFQPFPDEPLREPQSVADVRAMFLGMYGQADTGDPKHDYQAHAFVKDLDVLLAAVRADAAPVEAAPGYCGSCGGTGEAWNPIRGAADGMCSACEGTGDSGHDPEVECDNCEETFLSSEMRDWHPPASDDPDENMRLCEHCHGYAMGRADAALRNPDRRIADLEAALVESLAALGGAIAQIKALGSTPSDNAKRALSGGIEVSRALLAETKDGE